MTIPLATQLRPKTLAEFIGQQKVMDVLTNLLRHQIVPSMIFWGPPGTGKTSLAEVIAHTISAEFLKISAVTDGKDTLKKVVARAQINHQQNVTTILFIDEIHRWSKAQQDALLPFVESGEIILIGATTENPSFSVISALLSRTRVVVFEQHTAADIRLALAKGLELLNIKAEPAAIDLLAEAGNGDMRSAINALELAANSLAGNKKKKITLEIAQAAVVRYLRYDKTGEEHYNLISAVHKSLRSSNASAAAYWVLRMINAGEDPMYIARRLVRFASEDIGNANPNALLLANLVYDTCHKIGLPECKVALVQLVQYLAKASKDNSAYVALGQIERDIEKFGNLEVPLHLRNAPTQLMKDIGYGTGYEYDHNLPGKKSAQQCLPDKLKDREYFPPK